MKVYNILIRVTFLLAMYSWIYSSFLYEIAYVQYLPYNNNEEFVVPIYSPNDLDNGETYSIFDDMPFWSVWLYKFSLIAFKIVHLNVLIIFMLGVFLAFKRRKILNFKWYVTQILLFSGILFFIVATWRNE